MKMLLNVKMDVYIIVISTLYALFFGIFNELDTSIFEQMIYGLFAALISFVLYYVYEILYSLLLYKMRKELLRFIIGLSVSLAYLIYLTTVLFAQSSFTKVFTDINLLSESLANVNIIVSVLIIIAIISMLYGHTLAESLYRLAFMYVVPIGHTMLFFYFNPLRLENSQILVALNIFLIYMTLRQIIRSRGLVALNERDG